MDDDLEVPGFTKKGLQHLLDRASLRHSIAEQEEDLPEASMCFAEMLALIQLADAYGWTVVNCTIQEEESV